jgi:hypothetical protein
MIAEAIVAPNWNQDTDLKSIHPTLPGEAIVTAKLMAGRNVLA